MSFHSINYLDWLFLLPFLILIYIVRIRIRENKIKKWIGSQSDFLRSPISETKRHLKLIFGLLSLTLIVIALARPQMEGKKLKIQNKGVYMFLLVDASNSMLAEDVKPNRLSFMKREISRLIALSSGDQIALGLFANSAILASPFTKDFSAVKSYLQDISTDYLTNQGTNFERAFLLSEKTFKKIKENEKAKAVKVLIIASDGESPSLKYKSAIEKLISDQSIHVFTLSFGTKEGGVIPIKDYQGQVKSYKKDSKGNLVVSRLQEEILKNFAKWGKGSYYHVTYGSSSIEQLRQDLDQLKKTTFETTDYTEQEEVYQWFLILAFLIALIELFLNDRAYKKPFYQKGTNK